MAKKDCKLVAYVDAGTFRRFNALANRLGDQRSALLRKLVIRAIKDNAAGLVDPGPLGKRRPTGKSSR